RLARDDAEERIRDAVRDTFQRHARGQEVTGAPTLAKYIPDATLSAVRHWLKLGRAVGVTTNAAGTVDGDPIFHFEHLANVMREPDAEQEWVVDLTLKAGGFGLLVGKPKSGKTVTAQNLAFAVARGEPFLGRKTVQGMVFYLALEEQRSE